MINTIYIYTIHRAYAHFDYPILCALCLTGVSESPIPSFQRRSITEDCQADSLQSQAKKHTKTIDYQQSLINFVCFIILIQSRTTGLGFTLFQPLISENYSPNPLDKMHHGFPQRETIIVLEHGPPND